MLMTNTTTYDISCMVKPQETHEKVDIIAMGYDLFTYINIILYIATLENHIWIMTINYGSTFNKQNQNVGCI